MFITLETAKILYIAYLNRYIFSEYEDIIDSNTLSLNSFIKRLNKEGKYVIIKEKT